LKTEEEKLLKKLIQPELGEEQLKEVNKQLQMVYLKKEVKQKRIEFLIKNSQLTMDVISRKDNTMGVHFVDVPLSGLQKVEGPMVQKEKRKIQKFRQNLEEDNKREKAEYQYKDIRFDGEAKQARDFLKLTVIEVRALKNRLGAETIADFLMLYKEFLGGEKLKELKEIINESIMDINKTTEFIAFFDKIYKFEMEIKRVNQETRIANLEKQMKGKIFTDYKPEHLDLDEDEKKAFLDNFTKPKLIYEYAPYWFTPLFDDNDKYSPIVRNLM
jgi:hypothetical protein